MTADTNRPPTSKATTGAPDWPAALYTLRACYRESRDLFSRRLAAHLHFLRWLVQTGRLAL